MSRPPLSQQLRVARNNRADYAQYLKLPIGSVYQGVLVTADKRRQWQRGYDDWNNRVKALEGRIRELGGRP